MPTGDHRVETLCEFGQLYQQYVELLRACTYSVTAKTDERVCPFNLLYWRFSLRHRERFQSNPRMGNMYRTWARMSLDRREVVLEDADRLLAWLDAGEVV